MYTTNKKAILLANQVIATHAPLILKELGLDIENDGILDRITTLARPLTDEHNASAVFHHTSISRGFMGSKGYEYQHGSGKVEVNAASIFYVRFKNKGFKEIKIARLTLPKKVIKRQLLFLLAHELRHYWQFITGEIWLNSARMGSINFMPYEWRWEERDANEFASKYVNGVLKDHELRKFL